jgi:hypothetical protein
MAAGGPSMAAGGLSTAEERRQSLAVDLRGSASGGNLLVVWMREQLVVIKEEEVRRSNPAKAEFPTPTACGRHWGIAEEMRRMLKRRSVRASDDAGKEFQALKMLRRKALRSLLASILFP